MSLCARPVPGAPFVNDELDAMLPVNLAHRLPVGIDKRLHGVALAEQLVPFFHAEIQAVTFAPKPIIGLPFAEIPGVVMHTPSIKSAELPDPFFRQLSEETSCPLKIAAVRSRSDEGQIHPVARDPSDKAAKLHRILFRRKITAAAPGFIADTPEAHLKAVTFAACCAQLRQRRAASRSVTVFHPLVRVFGWKAAQIRRQIRLCPR